MTILTHFRRPRAPLRAAAVLVTGGLTITGLAALAGPASAATAGSGAGRAAGHVVYGQTDNAAGNQVVAYSRAGDGKLTLAGSYRTGGIGGALTGSVVDHLASQGSLVFDRAHGLLYAVNAGSNTVSVFAARGDRLALKQVIGSGGLFPVSIASHGNLVYVVNALRGGSVQGYRVSGGRLALLPGSHRRLGLNPKATPQFTNTPGQVAFSPGGSQLIVTTKANGNDIDVYGVRAGGELTASPAVNSEPATVPFGITFDPAGHLVVANAGTNGLSTFTLSAAGTVTLIDSVATGQAATCWVAADGSTLFASNAGSANVSRYHSGHAGQLALLGQTSTDPGTVDAVVAQHGRYLYVQTGGNGIVDEYGIGAGGSLTEIGSVTVAGAVGGEGIAAA